MSTTLHRGSWIVTLPVAGIAVLYVGFVWLPGRRTIAELQSQIELKQQFLAQSATVGNALAAAQQELHQAEDYSSGWEKIAPARKDLPALYGKINSLAKEAGAVTTRFDPQSLIAHGCIREIPLTLGCTGTFGQVFQLLRSIESLPTTIWVDCVRIEKVAETAQTVHCELSLVVFSNYPLDSDYAKRTE
jgi:Tfp pilus assembly protein PilO